MVGPGSILYYVFVRDFPVFGVEREIAATTTTKNRNLLDITDCIGPKIHGFINLIQDFYVPAGYRSKNFPDSSLCFRESIIEIWIEMVLQVLNIHKNVFLSFTFPVAAINAADLINGNTT